MREKIRLDTLASGQLAVDDPGAEIEPRTRALSVLTSVWLHTRLETLTLQVMSPDALPSRLQGKNDAFKPLLKPKNRMEL